jgi:hypothetical protein
LLDAKGERALADGVAEEFSADCSYMDRFFPIGIPKDDRRLIIPSPKGDKK